MRHPSAALLTLALLGAAACSESNDPDIAARATAIVRDAAGAQVGTANITEDGNANVVVSISVTGMTEGQHGVHLHTTGACDGAGAFASAGAHYNPFTKEHGLENDNGAHAGDMPNIAVGANGAGSLTYTNPRVRLTSGANSLLDGDGSAIVVHAGTDDQVTDPQGNSGARIACGVLQAQ
jgi:Cu-Zn family superoxide dismutase